MKLIQVGAAVLNQIPLGWETNRRHIVDAIREARSQGIGLLCLPELAITGHGCEDAFQSPSLQRTALDLLFEVAEETEGIAVAIGVPVTFRKALFDAVCLMVDGQVTGFVAKKYLAGDGLYYEPRWFKPWPENQSAEVEINGTAYPLGDLFFRLDGVNIGFEICEDAWVADRPGSDLARRGVDIILNPSASHFAFDKYEIRQRFVLEGSRAFGVTYVYANLLGNESGRSIFDGGALIASGGRMLAEGPRFGFGDWHLISAVVDVDQTRMQQVRTGSFQPELQPRPGERVNVEFEFPSTRYLTTETRTQTWEASPAQKEEEFSRAVGLALFDYLRKSRSRGFVVSLSGGADSTASSCLVALMVHLAYEELGVEELRRKLSYLDLEETITARELVHRLLLCVYQSTRNSSPTTRNAARTVAEALGAEFSELDVDPLVAAYTDMVQKAVGRELTWEHDDLALQNIQARVRGPGVWMLANLRGALLLATSNRSEAAVGYTTMDGDTCGGLSPIGGIDKAFLRQWLRWMETTGPEGIGPLSALSTVNSQEPTAELRPQSTGQTDEGDLMPYVVLDAVERAAIRDKKGPVEVYRTLRGRCPELDRSQLATWVERFFRLWCRNQWKRERYAPSFHVDDENLDPKTWCRFPILSGGFERELAELRAYVEAGR
ncbi:MAG: NAD(+) synthase [Acidobacteriota bacterium]